MKQIVSILLASTLCVVSGCNTSSPTSSTATETVTLVPCGQQVGLDHALVVFKDANGKKEASNVDHVKTCQAFKSAEDSDDDKDDGESKRIVCEADGSSILFKDHQLVRDEDGDVDEDETCKAYVLREDEDDRREAGLSTVEFSSFPDEVEEGKTVLVTGSVSPDGDKKVKYKYILTGTSDTGKVRSADVDGVQPGGTISLSIKPSETGSWNFRITQEISQQDADFHEVSTQRQVAVGTVDVIEKNEDDEEDSVEAGNFPSINATFDTTATVDEVFTTGIDIADGDSSLLIDLTLTAIGPGGEKKEVKLTERSPGDNFSMYFTPNKEGNWRLELVRTVTSGDAEKYGVSRTKTAATYEIKVKSEDDSSGSDSDSGSDSGSGSGDSSSGNNSNSDSGDSGSGSNSGSGNSGSGDSNSDNGGSEQTMPAIDIVDSVLYLHKDYVANGNKYLIPRPAITCSDASDASRVARSSGTTAHPSISDSEYYTFAIPSGGKFLGFISVSSGYDNAEYFGDPSLELGSGAKNATVCGGAWYAAK